MGNKVAVKLTGSDKAHTYEGNHEVALGPDAVLIVNEIVPDVTGKSKSGNVAKLRSIYNPTAWDIATVGD